MISRSSSSRLAARSVTWVDRPVILPPGRARLATRPSPTGSRPSANTMGMADVARLSAGTAVPAVTMTSGLRRTSSLAISTSRSLRPSAQRYSSATVWPSIQPSSRSRCTRAAVHGAHTDGDVVPTIPMVGSFPVPCAVAAIGHATAAPPSAVMNSRRLIGPTPGEIGCSLKVAYYSAHVVAFCLCTVARCINHRPPRGLVLGITKTLLNLASELIASAFHRVRSSSVSFSRAP
jgi:hypothetical protein